MTALLVRLYTSCRATVLAILYNLYRNLHFLLYSQLPVEIYTRVRSTLRVDILFCQSGLGRDIVPISLYNTRCGIPWPWSGLLSVKNSLV